MRIAVILDKSNRGWIIEKMAYRLVEGLNSLGHNAEVLAKPSDGFEVVHWMHYLNSRSFAGSHLNSMMVTHIDEANKLVKFKRRLEDGIIPIFLSKDHSKYIASMMRLENSFEYIFPASDLSLMKEDKLRFIITSHVYPDKRKNENFLTKLSKEVSLVNCEFILCGKRWSKVAKDLMEGGATVLQLSPELGNYPMYADLVNLVRQSDVFLYMGFDEGSMGALDAYMLGKRLIVSNQGFHREFQGSDVMLFDDFREFASCIKSEIERKEILKASHHRWSWQNFAECHLNVWEKTIEAKRKRDASKIKIDVEQHFELNQGNFYPRNSGLVSYQGLIFILRFIRTSLIRELTRIINKRKQS